MVAAALVALAASSTDARANGRFPASNMLVAKPGDPSRLALRATYGVLLSSDGGGTWDWICEKALGYGGAEDPSLVVTASGAIVVGMFRETARSTDGGCTWQHDPAWPKSVVDLALRAASPDRIVAATCVYSRPGDAGGSLFDGALQVSEDDGATWRKQATFDPALLIDSVEVAESDPGVLYVSGIRARGPQTTGVLLASSDGGLHFREAPVPFAASDRGVYIAGVDPKNASRVYLRVASVDAGRLLVSEDKGATMREVYRGGTLAGFAIADEGRTVFVGGPKDGLLRTDVPGWTFEPRNPTPIQCLASIGSALWACTPSHVGYVLGASHDGGGTFSPKLHLAGMRGPLACPGEAIAKTCAADWASFRELVDSRLPSRDASVPVDAGADVAPRHAACSCRTPGGGTPGATWPLLVAVVVVAAGARARRGRMSSYPGKFWRRSRGRFILVVMKEQIWETPSFVELRMDAEIGSYQDDFDPSREQPAFADRDEREPTAG
jgi:hypothetical protein